MATNQKLELIKQYRDSWMSYLDAAKAANSLSASSPTLTPWAWALQVAQQQTTRQNQAVAQNATADSAAADYQKSVQDAIAYNKSQANAWVAWVVQFDSNNTALNNTWVSTSTPWVLTSFSSPAQSSSTNTTNGTNNSTQWNQSTITWGSFGAWSNWKQTSQQVVEWQTNKVIGDTVANYDTNKAIDYNQYQNQIDAANAKSADTESELKRFQLEKEQLALQEDSNQKQAAAQEAANMQALQEKERASNEASIAAAQDKADAAERELAIANDIELQKSNVAFAKMGLTLSTAAVTSAQQIYTTWIYNLSKLKSENAFKMSELRVSVAKVEFDHTKVINDIINKSSDKSYEIRKKLNEDIHTIKNSIIDNRFERQKNIDKAIDTYQQAIKDNEDDVLAKMNKANEVLQKNVEWFYSTLKTKEEYNNNKINTLVSSGKWYAMTPLARSKYEKGANLPTWTVARQVQAAIGTKIYKQAQEITWLKWVTFSSADYNSMLTEAQRLAELGIPLDTAINQVVSQYIWTSPEYQANLAKQGKAWTTRSGWGWISTAYWTSTAKEFYIDDGNGWKKLIAWSVAGWKNWAPAIYMDAQWNPVIPLDIGEDTNSAKPSISESIRAMIEKKKAPTK